MITVKLDQLPINTICALSCFFAPADADFGNSIHFQLGCYVGDSGRIIGIQAFGASAPLKELQSEFGFEPELLVIMAKEMLEKK